jgi:hypothetical protein
MPPRERLREIADRMRRIFFAGTREEAIAALFDFLQHALHDVGWLLNRERALRERLQGALRRIHELEHVAEKTGLSRPTLRPASRVEDVMRLSQEIKRDEIDRDVMLDAFSEDEEEWFETSYERPPPVPPGG